MPPAKKSNAVQKGKKNPKTANVAIKKPGVATRRSRRLASSAADNVDGDTAGASASPSGTAGDSAADAAADNAAKKPATTRRRGRKNADGDAVTDQTAGPSGNAGIGAADGATAAAGTASTGDATGSTRASAGTATAPVVAPPAGAMTRSRRRALEAAGGNAEEQKEGEKAKEEEREHRAKKRRAARENKATIPPLQSADNADSFYQRRGSHVERTRDEEETQRQAGKEKAARPRQRLKLNVSKGPAKVILKVGQRSQDIENDRLAKRKDREDRAARDEPVTPSPVSSPRSDPPASSPSEGARNNPGRTPRERRFLCGVDGCSGGAYDFAGLRSHYKSVHKGRGMPKSENDVRKANFLDWLNDRIDGNPATRQAKKQYSDWLGVYPGNDSQGSADKENDPPEDALSDAFSETRKRRREEAEAEGEGQTGKSPDPKRHQHGGKDKYGNWADEEVVVEKLMARLREEGRAPLQLTQGQNFVEQTHLEEVQRISDEQEDENKKLRKTLRQNQLQLEAARRAGDYAIYELNNAKERQRALEQIASDNDVSLPKTEVADEYQKLLLEQAFGEEEPELLAEQRRWERNLLQRRTFHVHRRRDQTDDEWDAEESRVTGWQEPTDMEIDTSAPHNRDEMVAEDLVFDRDEMPPRQAYAVPQNNPDDNVSVTGQEQEAEAGRRLAYPQRRFLREWATVEQILPRATVPDLTPATHGPRTQNLADQPADENQQLKSNQPPEENQQQEQDKPGKEDQSQNLDQPPKDGQERNSSEQNEEWGDVPLTVLQRRQREEQKEREEVSRQARNSENLVNLSDSDDEQPTSTPAASQMLSRPLTAAQGSSGSARQGTENAPADDATAQQPGQGGFKPPVSRSKNVKWPCIII